MTRTLVLAIPLIIATLMPKAQAFELELNIQGEQAQWVNAASTNSYTMPAYGEPTHNLLPTNKWVPGSGVIELRTLSFTRINGSTASPPTLPSPIEVPISNNILGGMVYSIDLLFTHDSNVTTGLGNAKTHVSGSRVIVTSTQDSLALGNKELSSTKVITPFSTIRPLFNGDILKQNIIKAFTDKNKPVEGGVYRARLPIQYAYEFYYQSGARGRYQHTLFVDLKINYTPSQLISISKEGSGVILPRYEKDNILGETSYKVTANGTFSGMTGIKMTLLTAKGGFVMSHINMVNAQTIPYGISCRESYCSQKELVDTKGEIRNKTITINNSNGKTTRELMFHLDIKVDQPSTNITDGHYSGYFVALFELNI